MDELFAFRRPQWRPSVPAMWIGRDRVRLGDSIVLDRMAPLHVEWITGLDGLRGPREIIRTIPFDEADGARIVRALIAAGALRDASRLPTALRWLSPAAREDAMARYEAAIDCYRDDDRARTAIENRQRTRIWVTGDADLRTRIETTVLASGLAITNSPTSCDVAILADASHPDVPRVFDDPVQRLPHVHVGILESRAIVGPLVIPGRTSCLRCTHIHRTDADREWPLIAVQWSQRQPARPEPLLGQLAMTHAVALVRAYVDDAFDECIDRAWEIRLPWGAVTEVPRPSHPLCGCQWLTA